MKRTPLRRYTPLKSASTQPKRSSLSPVSKKRKAILSQYSRMRVEFLTLRPHCEAGPVLAKVTNHPTCTSSATQVHHMKRRGPYMLVTPTWLPVCANCHQWIETHANVARELNLIRT
jgi:hypothetical protein